MKIAGALGVSVEYLVTGKNVLPNRDLRLVADFSSLSRNDRKSVLALIAEMKTHGNPPKPARARSGDGARLSES